MVKDRQRKKVYRWEDKTFERNMIPISIGQALTAIENICKKYHIEKPEVQFSEGRGRHYYSFSRHLIRLMVPDCSKHIVLHESAHMINDVCEDATDRDEGHGPMFVAILLELLGEYYLCHDHPLLKTAEASGIQVSTKKELKMFLNILRLKRVSSLIERKDEIEKELVVLAKELEPCGVHIAKN